jgi:hypothetical protein
MRRILLLGAALALASPLMLGQASAAGTFVPHMNAAQSAAASGAIVEKAGWHRCVRWNRRCTRRWGLGSYHYRRCMWRHRCSR